MGEARASGTWRSPRTAGRARGIPASRPATCRSCWRSGRTAPRRKRRAARQRPARGRSARASAPRPPGPADRACSAVRQASSAAFERAGRLVHLAQPEPAERPSRRKLQRAAHQIRAGLVVAGLQTASRRNRRGGRQEDRRTRAAALSSFVPQIRAMPALSTSQEPDSTGFSRARQTTIFSPCAHKTC